MTAKVVQRQESVGHYLDEIIDKDELDDRCGIPVISEQPQLDQKVRGVFSNSSPRDRPSEEYFEQAHRNLVISIHEPLKKKHHKHRKKRHRHSSQVDIGDNRKVVCSSEFSRWQTNRIRKTEDLSTFIHIESDTGSEIEDEKDRIAQIQHRTEHSAAAHSNVLGHRQRRQSRTICEQESHVKNTASDKPRLSSISNEVPEQSQVVCQQPEVIPEVPEDVKVMTEGPVVPIDHRPHEMFIELEELHVDDVTHKIEWVETARWMKYEEDVEESKRWGKPHVASLSFHSLLDLRKGLDKGIMMFNLDSCTLYGIAEAAVAEFVKIGLLQEKNKDLVMNALLLKHRHQAQRSGSIVHGSMEKLFRAERSGAVPSSIGADMVSVLDLRSSLTDIARNTRGGEEPQQELNIVKKTVRRVSSWLRPTSSAEEDLPHVKQNVSFQEAEDRVKAPSLANIKATTVSLALEDVGVEIGPALSQKTARRPLELSGRSTTMSIDIDDIPAEVEEMLSRQVLRSPSLEPTLSPTVGRSMSDCTTHQVLRPPLLEPSVTVGRSLSDSTPRQVSQPDTHDSDPSCARTKSQSDLTVPHSLTVKKSASFNEVFKKSTSFSGLKRSKSSVRMKKINRHLATKAAPGCEAAPVLVGKLQFLENTLMGMIRLSHAQVLDEVMELPIPVRFIFILLGPDNDNTDYHEMGRCISTLMSNKEFQEKMYSANSNEEVLRAINMFLDESVVLPPGEYGADHILPDKLQTALRRKRRKQKENEEDQTVRRPLIEGKPQVTYDPLDKSGQFLGGIMRDLCHLKQRYWSDLKDGINWASLESVILMLMLVLAPAVTFGGFMGRQTHGELGVLEMVLSTCIGGTLFGLVSGQPLVIVGSTGPIYVFEEHLYHFCHTYHIPFLEYRAWIGVWICLIFLLFSCLELGYLIRFFTRFTEEIVGVMVSLIFLYESITAIIEIFENNSLVVTYNMTCNQSLHPLHKDEPCPNTALFSLLLMLGTFILAYLFRRLRHSFYLRKRIRSIMSGFGLTIAMVLMILLARVITNVYVEPLDVPDLFRPTYKKRSWFIPLFKENMDLWMPLYAVVPAFLVSVLIFMETHLCGLLVNRDSNRLVKGSCPNLDMIFMGVILLFCSLFGLPWLCADPVRTVAHIRTLTVYSKYHAPGEKPRLLYIHEQRVTNIAVHLLCGLLLLNPVILQSIPLAVLLGVFLFLGVISVSSLQFTRRFKMLFMSSKHFPDYCFTRKVKTLKIHLYTTIQIVLSALLIGIKLSPISPIFPLCVTSLAALRRYCLPHCFSTQDLDELDKEEEDNEDEDGSDIDEYGEGIMS